MPVPNSFASATTSIPLSQLDQNFNTPITLGNTAIQLGNTVTTLNNMTLANATVSSGNVTVTSASLSGNLTFTGTGNRITGDFSNATIANRVAFQTSTTNGNTNLTVLPNGTSTTGGYQAFNNSDPTNASLLAFQALTGDARISSTLTGTGTNLPMTFYTGGSERMRVDTSGNVLIGTTANTAGKRLVVVGTGAQLSGGTSAQEGLRFQRISGAATITGINNDNDAYNALAFFTGATEAARIDTSGNLLVNTTTARTSSGGLTVETDGTGLYIGSKSTGAGTEGGEIAFGRGTDKAVAWTFDVLNGASPDIRLINASAVGVQIVNGATAWSALSDVRLKTNITPLRSVLDDIQSIDCINYHLLDVDTEETPIRIGVSAQSLVGKFDEVLDETELKGKEGLYYSVRYTDMVPILVKAIQELKAELDATKAEVAALKGA
jgi:hypothetical protein